MACPKTVRRKTTEHASNHVISYQSEYLQACEDLFLSLHQRIDVLCLPPAEEIEFLLKDRHFTYTWLYKDENGIRAFINVMKNRIIGESPLTYVYGESVLMGNLSLEEQIDFFGTVFKYPFWDNIDAFFVADNGCVDVLALKNLGFYKTPKKGNIYFVSMDGQLKINSINSINVTIF